MKKSALQKARASYQPKLPVVLTGAVKAVEGHATQSVADQEEIQKLFPNTYGLPELKFEKNSTPTPSKPINVGVILSGGQAPGGHNVISGLFDGIKKVHRDSKLYGFLMGPGGFVDHKYMELTSAIIDEYRNTGGFDIIGSGRTKLETKEQFDKGLEILKELDIKALVIIGGDDSNTNAAVLAEYYKAINAGVQVIGCPKTIDGDLKNDVIETSFGFDTATKVYSEVIGNIQRDCNSAKKYYHFIKLMGRSASHIALECALQCQPNICIVSEEVEAKDMTLEQVVDSIADVVVKRAAKGMNFGTVLIPEGLIEFIPAVKRLIAELNDLLAKEAEAFAQVEAGSQRQWILDHLSADNAAVYASLPEGVARQLSLRPRPPRQRAGFAHRDRKAPLGDGRQAPGRPQGRRQIHRQVRSSASLLRLRRPLRRPLELRRRLLLRTRLQRRMPDPRRRNGLYVERTQPHQTLRAVGCRRYPHHHDDEHGAPQRQDEARNPEGSRTPRRRTIPEICFAARGVG